MNIKLKDEIIKVVQENKTEFQLVNNIVSEFKNYIYNDKGEYLIGGEEVSEFISDFIELYVN